MTTESGSRARTCYADFLASKREVPEQTGIEVDPETLNPNLFPWQRDVVAWALRRGRAALFESCGLGKTAQQLEWSAALWRKFQKPALILCPVAVAEQTVREAAKFGIDAPIKAVASGDEVINGLNVTNYEKMHRFDPSVFHSVVLDESSILKGMQGKVRNQLCDAFTRTPYRLACTATPAPNDHMELGNHSEFLSIMQANVMLSKYFTHDGGNTSQWRLKGHARRDFWTWVASWAVSVERPSDLGCSDDGYILPPLNITEHVTESGVHSGLLFQGNQRISATNVHEEKRASLDKKADVVAGLVNSNGEAWTCWVDTNYEADALKSRIPDAVEIRGSDRDDVKAERLMAFINGDVRVLISKAEIAGFGVNMQHCCNTTYFAGYSFERWYQSVRRFWRFGQTRPVNVHLVMSDAEQSVAAVLKRKQESYMEMVREMTDAMRDGMQESVYSRNGLKKYQPSKKMEMPSWMLSA